MSDSVRPHRRQPTRLPRPWDSPGKNTGVGCHCLLQCMKVKSEREVAQSCPTLSDPMDCNLPGSSVHGIFQARVLGWGAIAQLDLVDIYKTFHPKTMNFTFFSSAHGTFSRIDHILGCKSSLGKFKKIEIIPSIFSDHNALRLDLNYRRKTFQLVLLPAKHFSRCTLHVS